MNSKLDFILRSLDGLLEQCRDLKPYANDRSTIESLEAKIKRLDSDWKFVTMFYNLICDFADTGTVLESLKEKIAYVTSEIEYGVSSALKSHSFYGAMSKMGGEIYDYLEKTHILKAVVGVNLGRFYFDVRYPPYGYERGNYLGFVVLNLLSIEETMMIKDGGRAEAVHALYKGLQFIEQVIDSWYKRFFRSERVTVPAVVDFLNHVESVAVRIAIQSCEFWFPKSISDPTGAKSKLDGLVDLYHEIDPSSNPKFLELNLEFLKAIQKFIPTANQHDYHFDDEFFRPLLTWKGGDDYYDFKKKIFFLASVLVTNKQAFVDIKNLDDSREDVQIFFAEIKAVVMEAASLLRQGNQTVPPSLSQLDTDTCLLKTEHFLKTQLYNLSWLYGNCKIEEVYRVLKQLTTFSKDLSRVTTKCGKKTLPLVQELDNEVGFLCQSYNAKEVTKSMVHKSLHQLLRMIVIFKAESFLMQVLSCNASVMSYERVQVESLLEHLKIFNLILTNQIKEDLQVVEVIFPQIEAFARRITLISYSFLPNKITPEFIQKMSSSFPDLSDKVHHIKAKLKELSPKIPMPSLPKTYELIFIDLLLKKLRDLLKHSSELIAAVKNHIEEIRLHLESFRVKVSESADMENPGLKDLGNHITDIAHKVDYVINSIEVHAHWQHFFWIYDLLEDLRLVDKQVSNIHVTDAKVQNISNVIQVAQTMISQDSTPALNEELVNLRDQEEIIIDRLIKGSSSHLDIVSIVGTPGIGKTTLARKVYQQIRYHFHRLAWCTVSQIYEKRELLLEIISDIHGLTDEIHQKSNEDLESKLRQCLLGNKYLIVMDDVWDIGAWDDLKSSFPDDCNGSRILLTGRLNSVALEIKPGSDPHFLRLLSEEESWKLLEKKVFKSDGCPSDFLLVGKEIAKHCKGLPLAVVAIAGLLMRTERRQYWWKKIAETLSSQILNDPENQCKKILEMSYEHLPLYLRACFLYLGAFIEDKDIPVCKLIRLWLAEGFIEKTECRSSEDVAEEYLMDLINRSLVIISKRRSNGKVKACHLHDLIRGFCQSKAKGENFMQLVTRKDKPYSYLPSSDDGFQFDFEYHLDPVTFVAHRLSIL